MKTFKETFDEIKAEVTVSDKGKVKKTFSRKAFDDLALAYFNEVDYTVESASTKDGKMVTKTLTPVKDLRKMVQRVLLDFGVDKQEAERILSTYQFKNVDGVYELCSELIYKYMEADKKFAFITKPDFVGSMSLKDVGESVKEYKPISKKGEDAGKPFKVKTKAHKVLDKSSKCPKWLKEKFD